MTTQTHYYTRDHIGCLSIYQVVCPCLYACLFIISMTVLLFMYGECVMHGRSSKGLRYKEFSISFLSSRHSSLPCMNVNMDSSSSHLVSLCSYSRDGVFSFGKLVMWLAEVEVLLKRDRYLFPHYRYFVREMRVLAYNQLLKSYRSLTLQYMADAFEVSIAFVDRLTSIMTWQ